MGLRQFLEKENGFKAKKDSNKNFDYALIKERKSTFPLGINGKLGFKFPVFNNVSIPKSSNEEKKENQVNKINNENKKVSIRRRFINVFQNGLTNLKNQFEKNEIEKKQTLKEYEEEKKQTMISYMQKEENYQKNYRFKENTKKLRFFGLFLKIFSFITISLLIFR